jgi:hypothetical protein
MGVSHPGNLMATNCVRPWKRPTVILGCCAAILASATSIRAGGPGSIHWKHLENAQLKLDGKPPLKWNVYQPEKKKNANLVLVLLGRRYLQLDIKAKVVYSVFPTDLESQGGDLESDDLANPSRVIPSTDWTIRDVGPAELVRLTLGDYGRVLEVLLAHPPDMRPFY